MSVPILTAEQREHFYHEALMNLEPSGHPSGFHSPEDAERARQAVAALRVVGWLHSEQSEPLAEMPSDLTLEEVEEFQRFAEHVRDRMAEALAEARPDYVYAQTRMQGAENALAAVA